MIVVGLMGGLGNQLFQYAAGRRLSLILDTELRLDLSFLHQRNVPGLTYRPYLLDAFNIEGRPIEGEELEAFLAKGTSGWKLTLNDLAMKTVGHHPFRNRRKFVERDRNFEPEVLALPDDRYLNGYFQSERYFQDIRGTLLKELSIKMDMDQKNREMAMRIGENVSVGIHVRRGDYYSNPNAKAVHAVDLSDYYRRAVPFIKERVGNCHFFVFSDEPEWAMDNLDLGKECTVVDVNTPEQPVQDLRLMSLCQHFIIANSSFSWWGAWLSQNPDKIIIAPKRWFLDDRNVKDRCPEEWIRI